MIDDRRIIEATEKAMDRFWASVTKSFPEAQSGDLSPSMTFYFSEVCEQAVREWAEANAVEAQEA